MAVNTEGRLASGEVDLHELSLDYGSPIHVLRAEALRHNARLFTSGKCEVYSSYKSNPVPGMLQMLHEEGIGAEVISEYELWLAFRLGVEPSRIIYNGPAKSDSSLRRAIEEQVLVVNLNSLDEIRRTAKIARDLGKRARVGIRVATTDSWAGQFGFRIEGGEALQAFRQALQHDSLDVVGLHVHRGHSIGDEETLRWFVSNALSFCDELRESLGLSIELLDLGGSLRCPTVNWLSEKQVRMNRAFGADLLPPDHASVLRPDRAVEVIDKAVDSHFARASAPRPRVLLEPGRALTQNTQLLVTTVLDVRHQEGDATYAILDAGVNIADPIRIEYHQLFAVNKAGKPCTTEYRLAGPICTPADILVYSWRLPQLERGDTIAIMDSGAYFVSSSTTFSFPRPAIVVEDAGDVGVVRRHESFADLTACDQFVVAGSSVSVGPEQ